MIGSDAPRGSEDGEPDWRSKTRKPLLMALARFGKAAYVLVRVDVIASSCHFRGRD
jgi:hypothetical protein